MIRYRKRVGMRVVTFTMTRPRSLRTTTQREFIRARSGDYCASTDFEWACMNGCRHQAEQIRHKELCAWIVKLGAYEASRIPRPGASVTADITGEDSTEGSA